MRISAFTSETDFFRAKQAVVDGQQGASDLGTQRTPTGTMSLALGFQAMKNTPLRMAQLL